MRAAHRNGAAAMRASYDSSAAAMDRDPAAAMHCDPSAAVRATHGNGPATMDPTSASADQYSVRRWRDGASGIRLDIGSVCEIAAANHEHKGGSERN
jgi:hypothetical protein